MLIFIEYAQCLSLPYIISRIQWRITMVQSKIIDFHRNRVAIQTEAAGDLLYMYLCNCIQGTLCLEQVLGFCCKYDEMCKVYVMNVIVFCLLNESQTNDRSPTICGRPLLFFFHFFSFIQNNLIQYGNRSNLKNRCIKKRHFNDEWYAAKGMETFSIHHSFWIF